MLKPFLAVIALVLSPPGFAGVLYYGGDPDATLGLGLVSGTDGRPIGPLTLSKATAYDDFVVPASGWTVTGLGGHFATEVPTAYWLAWEIRTGMSEGGRRDARDAGGCDSDGDSGWIRLRPNWLLRGSCPPHGKLQRHRVGPRNVLARFVLAELHHPLPPRHHSLHSGDLRRERRRGAVYQRQLLECSGLRS